MIIFELDGVLADCEHRMHFVDPKKQSGIQVRNYDENGDYLSEGYYSLDDKSWQPDWKAFYEACDKDKVIIEAMTIFSNFKYSSELRIWTGRCESCKSKTIQWFLDNWFLGSFEYATKDWLESILKMRPIDCLFPDDELKERWLIEALNEEKQIDFIFESDPESIKMWRRRGIFVFDCNQQRK